MGTHRKNPPEKRESLSDEKYNLRELAKKSLEILKQNETKKPIYLLKNQKNELITKKRKSN